jgi:FkbM family methyltransferase
LCVWTLSDKRLKFTIADKPGYSTISRFTDYDNHYLERCTNSKEIIVSTISLNDLCEKFNAPNFISYLSVDTEGSELEILREFDFAKYQILFLTCEHNKTQNRVEIYNFLIKKGFRRVMFREESGEDSFVNLHYVEETEINRN